MKHDLFIYAAKHGGSIFMDMLSTPNAQLLNHSQRGGIQVVPIQDERMLTAVWAVMWVQPTILAPARGFSPWALFLSAIRADMSVEIATG